MKEIWVVVPGFDDRYIVSSHGNIVSLGFTRTQTFSFSYGKLERTFYYKPKKLFYEICNGYYRVVLYNGKKKSRMYVHQIVCKSFFGEPKRNNQVNHIDGNRKNNNISNLEYVTPSENLLHAVHVTKTWGARNSKFSNKDILNIRKLISQGLKNSVIAKKYKVCDETIRRIKVNKAFIYIR